MSSITVMSFNLKRDTLPFGRYSWSRRADQAAEMIRKAAPDILGTQELTAGTLGDLERLLPQYGWVGQGRGGGSRGEYTAIFFLRERFRPLEWNTFWLSKTPERPSRDRTTPFPRICTRCRLESPGDPGGTVTVYNTHLDHISYFARVRGLREILRRIAAGYRESPGPTLLMGDFNATPESRTFRRWIAADLRESAGIIRDCYWAMLQQDKEIGCSHHGFTGKTQGAPIDYIFASRELAVKEVDILRERGESGFASDHYPVVARLEL